MYFNYHSGGIAGLNPAGPNPKCTKEPLLLPLQPATCPCKLSANVKNVRLMLRKERMQKESLKQKIPCSSNQLPGLRPPPSASPLHLLFQTGSTLFKLKELLGRKNQSCTQRETSSEQHHVRPGICQHGSISFICRTPTHRQDS